MCISEFTNAKLKSIFPATPRKEPRNKKYHQDQHNQKTVVLGFLGRMFKFSTEFHFRTILGEQNVCDSVPIRHIDGIQN